MELRRNRHLPFSLLMVSAGLLMLLCGLGQEWWRLILMVLVGGGAVLAGGVGIVGSFMAFRVHIGARGLTIKVNGVDRLVRWEEISGLVLDAQPIDKKGLSTPRLLLIPSESAGSDLRSTEESPLDNRPCMVLFEFTEIKDTPDQVAAALKRFAGDRFTDIREALGGRLAAPDFSTVLRGYEPEKVDELVRKAQLALASGNGPQRMTAKVEIDGTSIPVAVRGYDREQVDAFLRELSNALAVTE